MVQTREQECGDGSHWDQVFCDLTREHWANRERAIDGAIDGLEFVREIADDLCDLDWKNPRLRILTMQTLGGAWTVCPTEDVPGMEGSMSPMYQQKSHKQMIYEMVANRFETLGPFDVRGVSCGDASMYLRGSGWNEIQNASEQEFVDVLNRGRPVGNPGIDDWPESE